MRSEKTFNVVEFFSGIGSQAKALKNIGINLNIINTCEWNYHTFIAYSLIHDMRGDAASIELKKQELVKKLIELGISSDGKNVANVNSLKALNEFTLKKIYATVKSTRNLVDISRVKGSDIAGNIDIMTYSFPCQDLSNVGAFHGYNKGIDRDANSRSGLLWEVERILIERKKEGFTMPRFLLLENVPALNSIRHRKNFMEWQQQLNDLGYYNKIYLLNSKDFGLPQNRERLLMLSVLMDNDDDVRMEIKSFFEKHNLENEDYRQSIVKKNILLKDLLKTDYCNPIYKEEALESQPNATTSRQKIWDENVQLTDTKGNVKDDIITSTLTTKQDRHPNSGNLWVDFNNGKSKFRYLTPRECFMLMGFDEKDYDKVIAGNFEIKKNAKLFTRDNLIKMAGNSIAVNVLEAVFGQIIQLDNLLYI